MFAAFPAPSEPGCDDCAANAAKHAQQAVAPEIRVRSAEKIRQAQGGKPARRKVKQSVHGSENQSALTVSRVLRDVSDPDSLRTNA